MLKRHIYISQEAINKLSESMSIVDNTYEVGGILLGHKKRHSFYIVDLTISNNSDSGTNISFVLDGNKHMNEIMEIREKYICPPSLIGVWHSHIVDIDSFSSQDRNSHKVITKQIGGVLSIIVIQDDFQGSIKIVPYYVSKNNKESMCKFNIDIMHNYIPCKLIQRREKDE